MVKSNRSFECEVTRNMILKKQRYIGSALIGLTAGFTSAFLGIGGGVLLVPALVLFSGYEIKKAVGTSLVIIIPTAFLGAITHYFVDRQNLLLATAIILASSSVIGARIGAHLVQRIKAKTLIVSFSAVMVLAGLKQLGLISILKGDVFPLDVWVLLLTGTVAGTLSALLGIGGGIVIVPALSMLFGLDMHKAIATSLVVIVPATAAGSFFHARSGNVIKCDLQVLIPASLAGAVTGALLSNMLSTGELSKVFGIFLIACSIRLLHKGLQKDQVV